MPETKLMRYCHSVHLDKDKCKGCVNCIKRCPTEAIRVRDGKASIIEARCVDCGECVRICPNRAKIVIADSLDRLKEYDFNVALPAPAIYGQFGEGTPNRAVLAAFLLLGFDWAMDVALAADCCALKIREALEEGQAVRPLISSACPAVVQLIQVRFPNLIEHIIPAITPMRAAAVMARNLVKKRTGLPDERIGVFFISPCPGKVNAVNELNAVGDNVINGAIPIEDVYPLLREKLAKEKYLVESLAKDVRPGTGFGVGWARAGGELVAIGESKHIAVDGIHNVITILEDVERGKLSDTEYIEAQACVGGCVGGVLTVENPFISRRRVRILATDPDASDDMNATDDDLALCEEWLELDHPIEPRPALKLDENMEIALRKMEEMERILKSLPGLDCGSCGAPNCQALAEDVVRGLATEMDCTFKLRERVHQLAQEMSGLASKLPPAMGHVDNNGETSDDSKRSS